MAVGKSMVAQISVGFSAGTNFCGVKATTDYSSIPSALRPDWVKYDLTTGYTVGVPVEIGLSQMISLFTGFSYIQKGSKATGSGPTINNILTTSKGKEKFNFLDLPVLAKFYFIKKKVNAWIMAGPDIGYLINGKMEVELTSYNNEQGTEEYSSAVIKRDWNEIKDLGFRRLEYSLITGIGCDYGIGKGKLFLNVNYMMGLTNLVDGDIVLFNGTKQYNRGLTTTLGYMIPLTK